MSNVGRNVGVALGWTTLALTGLIEPIVGRGKHLALYHWDGRAANLFGPVLVLFGLVWMVIAGLLLSAERPGLWRTTVWGSTIALVPWLLANAAEHLLRPVPWLRTVLFLMAAGVLSGVLLGPSAAGKKWIEHTVPRFANAMLAVAFSGVVFLLQIGWFWIAARGLNDARPLHVRAAASTSGGRSQGRVIWIVFDELSYRQVYERRFPGLRLPAFDALAAQSVVFTNVRPAGNKTDVVLPSLIAGKPVAAIRAAEDGRLYTQQTESARWQPFAQYDSVFADALRAGYSTRIAGWYNPYCRILPAVLDHCFWRMYTELENGLASDASFRGNLWRAVEAMAKGRGPATDAATSEELRSGPDSVTTGHLEDYRALLQEADRLLEDPSADFVLLHMPVPHPEGIFDRRTGKFAVEGRTYLDNLELADRCLAEMRTRLERQGAWDTAAVVVMGDHSWRVNTMWRQNPQRWTAEEESATEGGHFDDRPAYVVKLPGEQSGMRIDTPFRAVATRELLDRLLRGEIHSAEQLAAWVTGR